MLRGLLSKLGPEARECVAFVDWFRAAHPREFKHLTFLPMGHAQKFEKIIRAAMGAKPGVSDYGLFLRAGPYAGLWLEGKATGQTWAAVSTEQRQWLALMEGQGFFPAVGYGFDHMRQIAKCYLAARTEPEALQALADHHFRNRISAKRLAAVPHEIAA